MEKIECFYSRTKISSDETDTCQIVFTIRSSGKYNGRVVACSNLDPEKYDKNEKKSPTLSQIMVKWFLALLTRLGWSIEQIDIDSAYLTENINKVKYIHTPLGFEADNSTQVGRLNRPL